MKQYIPSLITASLIAGIALGEPTERIYLSGTDFEHPVEWDFMVSGGMRANEWGKIGVPSQWELEGYGEYTYGRWYKEKGVGRPPRRRVSTGILSASPTTSRRRSSISFSAAS